MAIRLEERFLVNAPVDPVWDFMVDPRRVVACVPGGELEAVDGRTFLGAVKVLVGPLTLAYRGRVRLAKVDADLRRVTIVGEARERAGTDSARLTLESWLGSLPDGRTEVVAIARVDVAGRILRLGLGVLQPLGHAVFQEFAARVQERIEADEACRARGEAPPVRGATEPLRAIPFALGSLRAWVLGMFRPRVRGRP
jgi:carbon monoxide dehydrogenase subunit G